MTSEPKRAMSKRPVSDAIISMAQQAVPKGIEGKATFKLESLEKGIATITFKFDHKHKDKGQLLSGTQKGTWKIDVRRGRDLSLSMTGIVEVDGGKGGAGKVRMKRTVTYGSSRGSKPRDS